MKLFLAFIAVVIFCQFGLFKKDKPADWSLSYFIKYEIPPGVIYLGDNLFYDQTEITNHHWCEYLFWTKSIYGSAAVQYQSALPDTLCWNRYDLIADNVRHSFCDYYLRHPSYRNYPVVGITQLQTQDFSKWRSDRVMEYILIREGVFEHFKDQNTEDHFSIERYFKGEFRGIKPDPRLMCYPKYGLPSTEQYYRAVKYSDSLDREGLSKFTNTRRMFRKYDSGDNIGLDYENKDSTGKDVNEFVFFQWHPNKKGNLNHLVGNVAEWSSESDISVGYSWFTRKEEVNEFGIKYDPESTANPYTGFRNVCEWKKWEGEY